MPASSDPLLPSLSQAFLQARPGAKAAMTFLCLILCSGIILMVLLSVAIARDMASGPQLAPFASQCCWILNTTVLALCVYQTCSRIRSWILPGLIFVLIAASLTLAYRSSLPHHVADEAQALEGAIALLHTAIQILAAGSVLALRRIAWLG
jgi:hypothetical protein